jgi:hypothetical protein
MRTKGQEWVPRRDSLRVPAELAGGAELIAIASALGDEEHRGR